MKLNEFPDVIAGWSTLEIFIAIVVSISIVSAVWILTLLRRLDLALGTILALSVIQLYPPLGYISTALICCCIVILAPRVLKAVELGSRVWLIGLFVYFCITAISIFWSPKPGAALLHLASILALGAAYLLTCTLLSEGHSLRTPLVIAAPFVLAQVGATIIFRLVSTLEFFYLDSSVSPWFSEPEVRLISSGGQQNVFDPSKSGGLFLNANIASLFLSVVALVYIAVWRRKNSWESWVVPAACALGIVATGSKSPLLIAALVFAMVSVFAFYAHGRLRYAILYSVVAVFALGVLFLTPALSRVILESFSDRLLLWKLAINVFVESPIIGLGYGGWAPYVGERFHDAFGEDRPFQELPPHNFLIQAWVDAGVLALVVAACLCAIPVYAAMRLVWAARGSAARWWRPATLCVILLWTPLHGFFDTTSWFGENHVLPWYAIAVALTSNWRNLHHPRFDAVLNRPGFGA